MNIYGKFGLPLALAGAAMLASNSTYAEDWTISAAGSCHTSLGSTVSSGGGIKASGGTAVVVCPLTKEVTADALTSVYARMKRASASGANPFCNINNTDWDGAPSAMGYGFATSTTNPQSISLTIPDQYYSGYSDVYCVLNNNDILYGIRYIQKN
jgi:hypothetical protein